MNENIEVFRSSPGYVMTIRVIVLLAMGMLCVSNYILLREVNLFTLFPLAMAGLAMFNIEHKVTLTNETLTVRRGIYKRVYPLLGTHFRVSPVSGVMSFLFAMRSEIPALYATPYGGSEKRFMLIIPNGEGARLAAALEQRTQGARASAGA